MPVYRFACTSGCHRLVEISTYSYDEVAHKMFFGVRAHMRIYWRGVIVGMQITPADAHELHVAEDMLASISDWVIGDRIYWSSELTQKVAR